ncbi:hypothetical protein SAMN05216251_1144 [Actinacidiphila alni]|uniref:Uncharacterized protein n=1 Tax=Actinacidiphila alni TaxID=380248 RepID=A0A1I2IM69_9ACTN|nr:hypothetical protein [Actinacidiphila alni]SFF42733.1 hypothetical protein SAMN05216251_1144 [Actinacidiphila alni]
MTDPAPGPAGRPTGFARVWEAGRIGAPTRGAAWARGAVTLLFTVVSTAGVSIGWAHATYAGSFAVAGVALVVVASSITMVLTLYWLHGSFGQVLCGFLLLLFCMIAGGFAVSNALFAARGEVSSGVITGYTHRTTLRTSWDACRVRLDSGAAVDREIRCGRPKVGKHVTVTQDPSGLAAPAFSDRTDASPVLPAIVGGAFVLLAGTVLRATATGERYRLTGTASPAQAPNPGYYPRRLASPGYGSRATS